MKGLTEKQRRMLDFIEDFMSSSSMAPTVYEIADHFKIKTSTVFAHLRALQRKSYLTRSSKARSISLLKPKKRSRKKESSAAISVPIIGGADAGAVPAQTAQSAPKPEEGAKGCDLFCDPSLVGARSEEKKELFALRIQGHGLKDVGILDGDIVVVKPATLAKSGDIVVESAGGSTIVKSFKQQQQAGSAQPQLGVLPPQGIKGVVVAVQRKI